MRLRAGGIRFVSMLALLLVAAVSAAQASESRGTIETRSGAHELSIELADTPEQRERGLMFRKSMPADQGMLFDFDESRPVTMWMKNTFIPLDMLFLNEKGVVTHIKRMAQPQSLDLIPSGGDVRYVLELNGGTVERLRIEDGSHLRHPLISNGG